MTNDNKNVTLEEKLQELQKVRDRLAARGFTCFSRHNISRSPFDGSIRYCGSCMMGLLEEDVVLNYLNALVYPREGEYSILFKDMGAFLRSGFLDEEETLKVIPSLKEKPKIKDFINSRKSCCNIEVFNDYFLELETVEWFLDKFEEYIKRTC